MFINISVQHCGRKVEGTGDEVVTGGGNQGRGGDWWRGPATRWRLVEGTGDEVATEQSKFDGKEIQIGPSITLVTVPHYPPGGIPLISH